MSEPTLRDAYTASVEAVEKAEPSAPVVTATPEAPAPETRTDDRPRDAQGRFVKTEAEQAADAAAAAKTAQNAPEAAQVQAPAPKPRPAYPSHWKRDYEALWGKVPEELLPMIEYAAVQREQEFQKGVSTYKKEAERAQKLMDAIGPFVPLLQQHNIQPEQWISNLGNAHRVLATADPQSKLAMFAKLANDYQVPLQYLMNPQALQALQQMAPPQQQQADLPSLVESVLTKRESQQAVEAFLAEAPTKYPKYELVKDTMVRLLESEIAKDLPDAYERALRLDDNLWKEEQARSAQAQEAERQRQAAEAAKRAKAAAGSVKSASPSTTGTTAKGDNSLRASYAEALSSIGGRV